MYRSYVHCHTNLKRSHFDRSLNSSVMFAFYWGVCVCVWACAHVILTASQTSQYTRRLKWFFIDCENCLSKLKRSKVVYTASFSETLTIFLYACNGEDATLQSHNFMPWEYGHIPDLQYPGILLTDYIMLLLFHHITFSFQRLLQWKCLLQLRWLYIGYLLISWIFLCPIRTWQQTLTLPVPQLSGHILSWGAEITHLSLSLPWTVLKYYGITIVLSSISSLLRSRRPCSLSCAAVASNRLSRGVSVCSSSRYFSTNLERQKTFEQINYYEIINHFSIALFLLSSRFTTLCRMWFWMSDCIP